MTTLRESIGTTLAKFLRGSAVGIVATVVDMVVLAGLVELFGFPPQAANIPALVAGAAVQFLGCRYLVFRTSNASVGRQLSGFALTEAGTLILNGLMFHILVSLTPLPYPIARAVGTFVVFVGFSFPLWTKVFRVSASAR